MLSTACQILFKVPVQEYEDDGVEFAEIHSGDRPRHYRLGDYPR